MTKKSYGQIAFETYSAGVMGGFSTEWASLSEESRAAWGEAARAVLAEMISDVLPRTEEASSRPAPIKVASRLGLTLPRTVEG